MKIDIDEVESVLLQKKFDPKKVAEIIRELSEIAEEVKDEEPETPTDADGTPTDGGEGLGEKPKYEYVIVLNDKEGVLKDKEIAGWVVQQEENSDAATILSKIVDASKDQNDQAKKKKNRLFTLIEMFEGLKPKFLKSKGIKIKTKDLTRVIIVDSKFKPSTEPADNNPSDEDIDNMV